MTTEALTGLAEAGVAVTAPPHPAKILETDLDHVKYAIAVTEDGGLAVEKLDDTQQYEAQRKAPPPRVTGNRTVCDLDSFLSELVRRPLHDSASTLWGKATAGKLTAVYNDHDADVAGWRDDQLTLQLATDPDWAAWHQLSGKFMAQGEFGDKVEELLHTVVQPDQAELLEIIDSVRASSKGEFEASIERSNGGQKVAYSEEVTTKAGRKGQLEVPQLITLEVRPWEGHAELYLVDAYFRLRISNGSLQLAIKLKPTAQIVRNAWSDVTTKVVAATSKPVYAQP